jgi:pyruvate formate lyase activating enzyme
MPELGNRTCRCGGGFADYPKEDCKGISWTYNEPTLWFEYTLTTARLAKDDGLLTNYVTNGSLTLKALDLLGPHLDAFRVDLKGFSRRTYERMVNFPDFRGILKTIVRAKTRWAAHVEIVTNVIPGVNDDEEELKQMACWITEHLGPETPWHLTRFYPHHHLAQLEPTPVVQLEKIREIGLGEGLQFVYLGNVPGHEAGNTYCPGCREVVIERFHCEVVQYRLEGNRCPSCGYEIAGCFES